MSSYPKVFRSEAESHRSRKVAESFHLPVKPHLCVGTKPICPAHPSAEIIDPQLIQPLHGAMETGILEVKPLADAHARGKAFDCRLGGTILPQQAHIVVPIICASFRFFMASGSTNPMASFVQTTPVHTLYISQQQFSSSLQAEDLHLLRTEGGRSNLGDPDCFVGNSPNFRYFLGPIVNGPARFQSKGKPWTATTSTSSSAPWLARSCTKWGSMGEIPPNTIFTLGLMLSHGGQEPALTMAAKVFHSGSILKSQCERLLGSFHNITVNHERSFPSCSDRLQRALKLQIEDVSAFARSSARCADPGF